MTLAAMAASCFSLLHMPLLAAQELSYKNLVTSVLSASETVIRRDVGPIQRAHRPK